MIKLKSAAEIKKMRQAGKIVAAVLQEMERAVAAGVTTGSLDKRAERIIRRAGALPAFLGYHGYPASICTSITAEVVHGMQG